MPTIKELAERRGKLVGAESSREKRKEAADAGLKAREAALQEGAKPRDAAATGEAAQQKVFADERARINNPLGAGDGNRDIVGGQAFQPGRDSGIVPEGFRDSGFESQAQQAQEAFDKLREEAKGLSQSYQDAIETLTGVLGEQKDLFAKQMEAIQKQTGMAVDTTDPEFQGAIKAAAEAADAAGEVDFTGTLKQFLVPQDQLQSEKDFDLVSLKQQALDAGLSPSAVQEAEVEMERARPFFDEADLAEFFRKSLATKMQEPSTPSASAVPKAEFIGETPEPSPGAKEFISPQDGPTEMVNKAVVNLNSADVNSLGAFAAEIDPDSQLSSAEYIERWIFQQMNQQAEDARFVNALEAEKKGYLETIKKLEEARATEIKEINAIMEGEDLAPTSVATLNAKILFDLKEQQGESIEAQREYAKKRFDLQMQQEREKRGRLEGYLKAKLYAAGSQDSSAGLAVMAMQVNAADLRLQLAETDHQFLMGELNRESRNIMENFTNQVLASNLQAEKANDQNIVAYEEKISEVNRLIIADERERDQLKMNAISQFSQRMFQIEKEKNDRAFREKEFAYQKTQDLINNIFESRKFELNARLTETNIRLNELEAENYGQPPRPGTKAYEEWRSLKLENDSLSAESNYYQNNLGSTAYDIEAMETRLISGGASNGAGRVNPVDLLANYDLGNQQRGALMKDSTGTVVARISSPYGADHSAYSGEKVHNGLDLVFKDANGSDTTQVKALKSGTVVKTGYAQGTYGGYVWLADANGDVFQYGHLNVDEAEAISIGTKIEAGQVFINHETRRDKWGAASGAHVDLRYVGKAPANVSEPTEFSFVESTQYNEWFSSGGKNYPAGIKTDAQRRQFEQKAESFRGYTVQSGTPISDVVKYSSGRKELTAGLAENLQKHALVSGQLDELEAIFDDLDEDDFGPISGVLRSKNPLDVKAQELKARLTAIIPGLARGVYGEVGVLTDNDIRLYQQTVPNLSQTGDVREAVLKMTRDMLRSGLEGQLRGLAGTYDVTGYQFLIEDIISRDSATLPKTATQAFMSTAARILPEEVQYELANRLPTNEFDAQARSAWDDIEI